MDRWMLIILLLVAGCAHAQIPPFPLPESIQQQLGRIGGVVRPTGEWHRVLHEHGASATLGQELVLALRWHQRQSHAGQKRMVLAVSQVCAEFAVTGLDSFADSAALPQESRSGSAIRFRATGSNPKIFLQHSMPTFATSMNDTTLPMNTGS